MKRLEVTYRSEAEADLLQIYRWVYEASLSPEIADRFLNRLLERCDRIGDAPHGGRPRDDLEPGLRTVPFEHSAVIAYRVEADRVRVVNVFYGGRDFEALYRGHAPDGDD
ncbi:type II toxin-antitoxin system RelE/ParE family toxin [Methylorubrum extorquens]|jgi:toxin ParE1/3/4|uniref:type II toxin-antitoxin system RelE/ParE family toxin n=1 Tax=Methylorubrum extorquens TaxID=408 RepID=UPI0022380F3F|nr:type II toxin-antitoxin system RelE/ParE family toxin [Methylorubrum extorquens]UYW29277.1 type II toxin-antitoxin system RelE/ParE family toxin [Methylorubrum extorquens]UYW31021.1 type II toxin-antitoxin system RelE/ParE family toxin [Methylorubrum extorquens]